ncbi:unnamed protein product [Heterosigma akashiwo]|mmetsp:Transcript_41100/g.60569  ORF Transcript_41100/g.60569 Transcript_41100/m.60569 type:complete len:184 (-) Transcript_41100:43-594(-)
MGGLFSSSFWEYFGGTQSKRILMLGLDASGKTTILYRMQLGESIHTIPTIGFNCEAVKYGKLEFNIWDIGGQKKLRNLWRYYFDNTDALIFVVDSNDLDRIEEAKDTLHWLMSEDALQDAKLLVYANKQDLPHSASAAELTDKLGLRDLRRREWFIQSTCAVTGEGLYDGMEWLSNALKQSRK